MATRTIIREGTTDTYVGACTECEAINRVLAPDGEKPEPVDRCTHYRRSWRVSADGRIRAEFTLYAPPAAEAA